MMFEISEDYMQKILFTFMRSSAQFQQYQSQLEQQLTSSWHIVKKGRVYKLISIHTNDILLHWLSSIDFRSIISHTAIGQFDWHC